MQIGFVGLGKMGGNMVHRIQRDSDHEVVAFDFNARTPSRRPRATARPAPRRSRSSCRKLEAPRTVWLMVPAGEPTQQTVEKLAELLERGRHDHRRRQLEAGPTTSAAGGAAAASGPRLRRRRHERRRLGPAGRLLHDGRRRRRGGRAAHADPRRARPADDAEHGPGWGHFGPTGAGHYVKMVHNGVEYGMMQAYAEGFDDHARVRVRARQRARSPTSGSRARSCARGCSSWPRSRSSRRATTSRDIKPLRQGLGRGPLDVIEDAIDKRVPTPVITASLLRALRVARQDESYAAKVNAALRNQFGGHAVKTVDAGGQPVDEHRGGSAREPARRGARAAARPPDDAGHLRRAPATSPTASCCRRSTTSRTRARCRSAST